jgi:hypothetical protein
MHLRSGGDSLPLQVEVGACDVGADVMGGIVVTVGRGSAVVLASSS